MGDIAVRYVSPMRREFLLPVCAFYSCTAVLLQLDAYFAACGSEDASWLAGLHFWLIVCIEELPRICSLVYCLYFTAKLRKYFSKECGSTKASNNATWFDTYIRYLHRLSI